MIDRYDVLVLVVVYLFSYFVGPPLTAWWQRAKKWREIRRVFTRARGRALTYIAIEHGYHRRWFGLEPDWLLRRRINRTIRYWLR